MASIECFYVSGNETTKEGKVAQGPPEIKKTRNFHWVSEKGILSKLRGLGTGHDDVLWQRLIGPIVYVLHA